jgi:hypothetical protein
MLGKTSQTFPFIDFVQSNFNKDEHFFVLLGVDTKDKDRIQNDRYIISISKEEKSVFKLLKKIVVLILLFLRNRKIILHSLFSKQLVGFLFINPWFLKKCNWVIWGGDLYSYQKPKITMKQKIYEYMRAFCIKRFGGIVSLTPGDYKLAKKWYNTNAKEYFGMYINPIKKEYLDNIKTKEKKEVYIQIGNSATESNNHIEAINLLKKYKYENIKIFVPLSYGDKDYALKVKKYGEEIFGEKFNAMMDFLKPKEYSEYLGNIDILVFNHNRQQGLGNIYALVYLGKKIFIRRDISSWSFFEDTLDIKLANTLDIDKINFESFVANNDAIHNKKRAEETFYNDNYISGLWEKIFKGE